MRLMARLALRAGALALALALVLAASACTSEPPVDTLPEVTLDRLQGDGQVDLASVRGPAVVNLWASWCGPCARELPVAEAFHRQHGEEVQMIGVDYQDPQVDRATELADEAGLSYEQLADPDGLLDGAPPFPALRGLPFWVFVDARGRVVHREFVEVTSTDQLRAMVVEHLGLSL